MDGVMTGRNELAFLQSVAGLFADNTFALPQLI